MPQAMLIFFLCDFLNNIVADLSLYYNTLVRDLQERRRIKNFLQSPVLLFVLLITAIILVRSNYNIYKTNQSARISRDESDRKLASLREESGRLNMELEKLGTERGREDELRNKFQITKAGEEVLVVVDQQDAATQTANVGSADKSNNKSESYWQKLISFLGL